MQTCYLIVGLGNPEERYFKTFHNIGFMAIDCLADSLNAKFKIKTCDAEVAELSIAGNKVILAKPQTYMNLSGLAVQQLVRKYKVDFQHLLVLYDDYDIAKGKLKIRQKGSASTHNGMKSIIQTLNSSAFNRIRLGIYDEDIQIPIIKYVLSSISKENMPIYQEVCMRAAEACKLWLHAMPIEKVMNIYNV